MATGADIEGFQKASDKAIALEQQQPDVFPREHINPVRPYKNTRGISAVTRIGCKTFADLYNFRQLLTIATFYRILANNDWLTGVSDGGLREAVRTLVAFAIGRFVSQHTSVSRWDATRLTIKGAFSKQALAVVWDFAEANPFSGGSSDWDGAIEWLVKYIERNMSVDTIGTVVQADATETLLPLDSVAALITDPPYFASVPYGDLSDFFYVWMRRGLGDCYPDLFHHTLVNKTNELIVTDAQLGPNNQQKNEIFFQQGISKALVASRQAVIPSGIAVVVYAEATVSGWEAVLTALMDAGWQINASWPIDTEMENRTRAQTSASLQSSIHLVCRPRENADGSLRNEIGDWRDVISELPQRIHDWLPRLESEGVVGADAIFACLGPAMEIFSRYSRVEKASGEVVPLREYLEQVWAVVSREALNLIFAGADTTGFEEDARLTVIWFWSLQAGETANGIETDSDELDSDDEEIEKPATTKKISDYAMEYDTARKIAQGLGADLRLLGRPGGIVTIKGNVASLNHVREREDRLVGVQLSLFDENSSSANGKHRKQRSPTVAPTNVSDQPRQLRLIPEPEALPTDPERPLLPGMKALFEDNRSFLQRLIDGGETVLDRLHQAMLLHGRGQISLLGLFLSETGMGSDPRFWRLADALLRLYPKGTEEYRWLDGVLARKKGLGF
jgi:putative DNA methylase